MGSPPCAIGLFAVQTVCVSDGELWSEKLSLNSFRSKACAKSEQEKSEPEV
jgi:hypothetical protein